MSLFVSLGAIKPTAVYLLHQRVGENSKLASLTEQAVTADMKSGKRVNGNTAACSEFMHTDCA